jgi:hypothetical protein
MQRAHGADARVVDAGGVVVEGFSMSSMAGLSVFFN